MPDNNAQSGGEELLDLWPEEIAPAQVTPPAAIMQAQASLLGKRTKFKLRGSVVTSMMGNDIYHRFVLVAPTLQDYRYELFAIVHGVIPYPVRVWSAPRGVSADELPDEHAFVDWLRGVLSSDETMRIVGALLAQA
jgi:hypothetical protein